MPVIGTSLDISWHLGNPRSSTHPLHVSYLICLLDRRPSCCRTTLSMPGSSLSPADPPNLAGFVATRVSPVFGEFRFSSLRDINLPVSANLSEVLLLFGLLVLPPRNLSSPIPRPGNAPAAPMWNLSDGLGWPLLGSTTSLTPS